MNNRKSFHKPEVVVTNKSKNNIATKTHLEIQKSKILIPADKLKISMSSTTRLANFNKMMFEIRSQMNKPQQFFSMFIHNKSIEKLSDITARTILRPVPIIIGGAVAAIFSATSYLIAKRFGYPLSGSETSLGFIIGWTIGMIIDYLKKLSHK